jgi:hypothetical protein
VHTFTFVGSITTTRDAPAYQDAVYELVARVDQPGVIQSGSAQAKAMFTVKNDYVPQVSVEAPTLFLEVPQYAEVEFPVEIINRGNGPTRTRIEIIQTGPDRLMMINAGPEVRTESQAGRGASAMYKASRTIQAMAGPDVGIQSFAARFVSTYDGAASGLVLTDETVLHFSVNVLPDPNATQPAAPAEHLDPEFASAPMAPLIGLLMLGVAAWRRRGL